MHTIKSYASAAVAALLLSTMTIAYAQRPGGGPPPPPPVAAAMIPVSILTAELGLSSDQQTKIAAVQKTFQEARHTLAPPPPRPDESGQDAGGPPPTPPSPPDAATREKIHALETDASSQIEADLTDTQKTALASLIETMRALQAAGVSPRAYAQLKLTDDQKKQIVSAVAAQRVQVKASIAKVNDDPDTVQSILGDARRAMRDAVMAILTDTQKTVAERAHGGPGHGQGPDAGGPPAGPPDGDGPPPPMDGAQGAGPGSDQ